MTDPKEPTPGIRRAFGGAVARTVGGIGRLLGETFRLPALAPERTTIAPPGLGAPAGIEYVAEVDTPPAPGAVGVRCIDYSADRVEERVFRGVEEALVDPRPPWVAVRWIAIEGLHPYVVNRVRERLGLHTLAAEDVLNVAQRPRAEAYGDHLFVVTRVFSYRDGGLVSQQVSAFVRSDLLVTFQEEGPDIWQHVRSRLTTGGGLRSPEASYLAYRLIDTAVDLFFPVLEEYGEELGQIEQVVLTSPQPAMLHRIHAIKRDLAVLRRVVWPMRDLVAELRRPDQIVVSPTTRTFLGDVYEHCIQVIDIVETFRDLASSLTDLYMSVTSNRMNEAMQVLTAITTIFIPLSFLAGVYGMNFAFMPELGWEWGYPVFWVACVAVAGTLLWYFRRRGWLGGG
jgi:magnesium transporter